MSTIFKKGDKVFDIRYGWGEVTYITNLGMVRAVFGEYGPTYTAHGKGMDSMKQGLLSFTEYTLEGFSQERPEELPEVGQVVWAREFNSWLIGHFSNKAKGGYIIAKNTLDAKRGLGLLYREITTENPYK